MLGFLVGPLGKVFGIGVLVLSCLGAISYGVHQYNSLIEARLTVAEQASEMETMQKDRERIVSALEAEQADTLARQVAMKPIREAIANAKETNSCGSSPAVAAVVSGMRSGSASRNPGSPANHP